MRTGQGVMASLILAVIVLQAQPPAPSTLSKFDRGASLEMLRQIRTDLKDNYYDKSFRGLDVDAVFAEAERRLKSSSSSIETSAILTDVLLRLNDSHTVLYLPERAVRVDYGWRPGVVGNDVFVLDVTRGSDAEKKGLKVGDRLLYWNRFEPTRANLWQLMYLYQFVRTQSLQRVLIRRPDGSNMSIDIESRIEPRPFNQLSDLLEEMVRPQRPRRGERGVTSGEIFVWRYAGFGDPDVVARTIKKARGSRALVLDLRDNAGGLIDTLETLVSYLFERDVRIAKEIGRKGEKPIAAKGRKDAFSGPIVVLVDGGSASAAEMLARVVQIEKRGTVIGDRSAGQVMTARLFPHVLGIASLAFYATSITVGDVRMSDGGSLERTGVVPDETVLPSAEDLASGRDPVLARAIAVLGGTLTAEQAARLLK